MSINNSMVAYGRVARVLHWLMALLILSMIAFGFLLDSLPKSFKPLSYTLHKSTGLLLLFLVIIRVLWTVFQVKPKLPSTLKRIEVIAARSVQHSLYLMMFVMPISGWVMSVASGRIPSFYFLFDVSIPFMNKSKALASFAHDIHGIGAWVLVVFVSMHILAALKHHFLNKDGVLKMMLG